MPKNPSPGPRGHAARAAAGGLAVALFASLAGAVPAGAATRPAALVAASKVAAAKQSSVHYAAASSLGTQSITIVADVGHSSGTETIRLHRTGQTGLVSARYDGKAAYFKGNANGLTGYLGMPSSLASTYAGKWIAFRPSDKSYSAIAQSLTISAAIAQISINPPLTSSAGPKVGNASTVVVHGTTTSLSSSGSKGPATLSIRSNATPLPVTFTGTGRQSGKTEKGQVVFSRWNEPVKVVAPSSSVNASTITSSSGSSSPSTSG